MLSNLLKMLTSVIKEDKARLITYCVELWTNNDALYLGATDLTTTIIAKEHDFSGTIDNCVVSLPTLFQVAKSLSSDHIELHTDSDNLIVNGVCKIPIKKRIGKLPLNMPLFNNPVEINLGNFKTLKKYHKMALTNDDLKIYYLSNGEITTNTDIIAHTNLLDDLGLSILSSYAVDKLANFKGNGLFELLPNNIIGVQTDEYSLRIKEEQNLKFPIDNVTPFLEAHGMIKVNKKDLQALVTLLHNTKWESTKLLTKSQLYVHSEDGSLGGSLNYETLEDTAEECIIVPTKSLYDTLKVLGKEVTIGIYPHYLYIGDNTSSYVIAEVENG